MDKAERKMHICSNCRATFPAEEAYCPYCGVINPLGAEKQYMGSLHKIKSDLAALEDDHEEAFQKEIKTLSKRSVKTAVIIIAVLAALILLPVLAVRLMDRSFERMREDEIVFINQYFDELKALDESGDEAAVLARIRELESEEGATALYDWEHYHYYLHYVYLDFIREDQAAFEAGTITDSQLTSGMSFAWSMTREKYFKDFLKAESAERQEKAAAMAEEAEAFLMEVLSVSSSEEVDAFFEEIKEKDSDYFKYDKLKGKAKQILKDRGQS